jgi:hypothetical protein
MALGSVVAGRRPLRHRQLMRSAKTMAGHPWRKRERKIGLERFANGLRLLSTYALPTSHLIIIELDRCATTLLLRIGVWLHRHAYGVTVFMPGQP